MVALAGTEELAAGRSASDAGDLETAGIHRQSHSGICPLQSLQREGARRGAFGMKITSRVETDAVTDVCCDICSTSTRHKVGNLHYGVLRADWGYGALHDGERYEVHLCETCFFNTIAYLKQERRTAIMFEEAPQLPDDGFGLASINNFLGDGR